MLVNGVALIGERPEQGFFDGLLKRIDQLAPTVFGPSLGPKELGAKAVKNSRISRIPNR
jgi:hypothetical protein